MLSLSTMTPKKILIFSLAYQPFMGGAELAVKEITDRISSDFSFDMVTLRFDSTLKRQEKIGRVTVYRVGPSKKNPKANDMVSFPLYVVKVLYPIFAFFKAVELHRKNHYDGIWVMMAYAGFPAVFFRFLYPRVPYLLTLQEGDSIFHMTGRLRIKLVYPFFKSIFLYARLIQTISTYLSDYARSMGARAPISVVPNGVDIKNFESRISNFEKLELRKKIGIDEHDKVVITTSRLVEKNAVNDVIKALSLLPSHVKFLIVGSGPLEEKLRALARAQKVEDRVIFAGHIPYEQLPSYYHMADIFIRPSLSEGMGSSFIEAMAAGIPIIGTLVGGITDFLKDGETGFVCVVRNPESIVEKIKYILDERNKPHIQRVLQTARELTVRDYSWDLIAQKMKQLLLALQ